MVDSATFAREVRSRLEKRPEEVAGESGEGFDVVLDVVDTRRFGERSRPRKVRTTYRHQVRLKGDRAYTATTKSKRRPWPGEWDGYQTRFYQPQDLSGVVKEAGDALGLERRMGATGKVAIAMAVLGVLGALLAVLLLLL